MFYRIKNIVVTTMIVAVLAISIGISASAATITAKTNLRTKASASSKVITKVYSGSYATVLSKAGSWSKVRVNNRVGYIYSSYVSDGKKTKTSSTTAGKALYSASSFKRRGVINWNGWKWTWYSQRVLPGKGLKIPGRHVDSNGYVCDKNGYICLASTSRSKGTVVSTPFGKKGKVYDSGCSRGIFDVYVNW